MDRFAVRLTLGYVSPEEEVAVLSAQEKVHPLDAVSHPCVTLDDVLALKRAVTERAHQR